MRAKFINEIKQNVEGSGLAPIGIGHVGILKGYKEIKKQCVNFQKDSYLMNGNPMITDVEPAILKIAEIFDCKKTDFIFLKKTLIKTPSNLNSTIIRTFMENVVLGTDNVLTDDIILKSGKIKNPDGVFEPYYVLISKYWQVAKINLESNFTHEYYLIRYK